MRDIPAQRSRGVQSVEIGIRLLSALAEGGRAMALSELAGVAKMSPAKVHRYLASFVETGMVEHRRNGFYDLGRCAAEIGVAAIGRVDVVNRAADRLADLVDRTGATAMLSVWGTGGPTVVRWERTNPPLVTALGVGSVMPLLRSATGLVFLAWLPERLVRARALAEGGLDSEAALASLRETIRTQFVVEAEETFIPGLFALAAPVLDLQHQAAAAVTLIGTDMRLVAPGSPARAALRESVMLEG